MQGITVQEAFVPQGAPAERRQCRRSRCRQACAGWMRAAATAAGRYVQGGRTSVACGGFIRQWLRQLLEARAVVAPPG